ncbi:hypothetical protein PAHAL_1G081500 [Panicum hallii]|nr:hypothetical protein PAHAL_1G081500 [Panicum hallii]
MFVLLARMSTGQPAKLPSWAELFKLMQSQCTHIGPSPKTSISLVYQSICFTPKSHGNCKQVSGFKAMEQSKRNQTDMIVSGFTVHLL